MTTTLSGYDVKNDLNPDGDISVDYVGLRPGEKLYEELLIGDNVTGTEHSKIMRANEACVNAEQLIAALEKLVEAENHQDSKQARKILQQVVVGFQPSSGDVDLLASD